MNVLKFVLMVIANALRFAIMGAMLGLLIGVAEGAIFGVIYVLILIGAVGIVYGLPGAIFGGIYGAVQGAGCGALAGLIVGGRHWNAGDFNALHRGLNVARKMALVGGFSGGITGMALMWLGGPGPVGSHEFGDGFLYGSIMGWCVCCFGGTLVGGLFRAQPQSGIPPLDTLLRWLWDSKWAIKRKEVVKQSGTL